MPLTFSHYGKLSIDIDKREGETSEEKVGWFSDRLQAIRFYFACC